MKTNDPEFRKNCEEQLNAFHTNVLAQQTALAALGAEKKSGGKGLDNFDRTNDIEKLIKDTIDLHKKSLDAIYVLVSNLPILGPILGPSKLPRIQIKPVP